MSLGEVPLPDLEKNVRRTFFMNFTHAIGFLIWRPLAYPILRYLMKPMYCSFDNGWLKIGNVGKIKKEDIVSSSSTGKGQGKCIAGGGGRRNVWILKATPAVLEKVYQGKDNAIPRCCLKSVWTNKKEIPYVAFSGKCPHLGCGYKWRQHKVLGQVFLCPCHLSIYDASGKVLDGPAPRPLDALPIKVSAEWGRPNHRHGVQGGNQIADPDRRTGSPSIPSTQPTVIEKVIAFIDGARRPQQANMLI